MDIAKFYATDAFPVGIIDDKAPVKDTAAIISKLNSWWRLRGIPASRDDLAFFLQLSGVATASILAVKSLGLSLSDQYWLKPSDTDLTWEDVNFFTNDFSEDLGDIFFTHKISSDKINPMSPDASSNGWLKKRWKIINQKRYLAKAGSGPLFQEPYNEVIASQIMDKLGLNHVKYELIMEGKRPVSLCENFITPDTEYVPANFVCNVLPRKNNESLYQHLLRCTDYLNIPGVHDYLDELLIIDFLIENTDRHYGNFGFVRDVNSLKFVGTAPIFDNGTSLWCKAPISEIGDWEICSSFMKTQREQVKYIKNRQINNLVPDELEFMTKNILSESEFIDEKRMAKICKYVGNRARLLKNIIC